MWCSKQATIPALWLLPINLARPVPHRQCIEQPGNYGSKGLRVCSVVSFEGELQEAKGGCRPLLWERRQDAACKATSGYERYRFGGSPFLRMRKWLLGDGGVGRERKLDEGCKGRGVPLWGPGGNEFVRRGTWNGLRQRALRNSWGKTYAICSPVRFEVSTPERNTTAENWDD
jgi:hypothetical protein